MSVHADQVLLFARRGRMVFHVMAGPDPPTVATPVGRKLPEPNPVLTVDRVQKFGDVASPDRQNSRRAR